MDLLMQETAEVAHKGDEKIERYEGIEEFGRNKLEANKKACQSEQKDDQGIPREQFK